MASQTLGTTTSSNNPRNSSIKEIFERDYKERTAEPSISDGTKKMFAGKKKGISDRVTKILKKEFPDFPVKPSEAKIQTRAKELVIEELGAILEREFTKVSERNDEIKNKRVESTAGKGHKVAEGL